MDEQKHAHADGNTDAEATPERILEAVAYLDQCRSEQRCLAILSGRSATAIRHVLKQFLSRATPADRVVRMLPPADDRHAFLEALLLQLGFEPFESSADDLQRLLSVVLRETANQQATTFILVEEAQLFGPRVLEQLRELILDARSLHPPPLFILSGNSTLHRILDSRGMQGLAGLVRQRFDIDGAMPAGAAIPVQDGPASAMPESCLVLASGNVPLGRYLLDHERLLIGRGEHSDITILDRFVSRQHALFLRKDSGDWIIDLNSTNGTSVNSMLVHERRLEHGDVISLGNHRLLYHHPAARPAGPLPRAAAGQAGDTAIMRSLRAAMETGAQQVRRA
ncbi:MAG: FHA domain-containing protein [Gammaproteobacteria bacterium]|nr:FHA domain-containing protein [Gammaproteobacteria bacterium]